ncbi:MAG: FtsW/RodA/SpoVE family cell cycle protein [Lachnospiraceae bacterium]|nr:FtsW/RodA/SpoVE family cell cycle protein [Lachnospiraceae bacterium]
MALYTFQSYTVFHKKDDEAREYLFMRQNMLMFMMHFVAFMVLFLNISETTVLLFYGAQVIYLAAVLVLFKNLYPLASRLVINNMCMLLCVGFIMITRLSYDQSIKQFKIAVFATVVALLIPVIIRKLRFITKMYWLYTLVGIVLLALVAIAARSTYGAKLSFTIGGISIQPSEFVKIIYVFAIAGLLTHARDFRRIVIATGLAALHVLILVVSKDLGSALIFFITYLVMLFVSTKNPFYVLAGILSGSVAAVGAYFLFNHVRVRVEAWQDPFQDYQGGGYQICQSLFAISAGGWFGTGLGQGSPGAIPFVEQDMMFSAISEELGSIFSICLILVCMSCFIMFVNISMQLTNRFYRLVAVGLGSTYAAQVFLTVGGGIKLIPLTGVTFPLVSYGGSSVLSTLIMFSIVQGLYMLQRDEEVKSEQKRMLQEQQLYQQQNGGYYGAYGENIAYTGEYAEHEYEDPNASYDRYGGNRYGREQGPYRQNQYEDPQNAYGRPKPGRKQETYTDSGYGRAENTYADEGYGGMRDAFRQEGYPGSQNTNAHNKYARRPETYEDGRYAGNPEAFEDDGYAGTWDEFEYDGYDTPYR